MGNKRITTCCFLGHRKIIETDELKTKLYNEIEKLISEKKADTFLFGSKSQFNDLCYKTVTALKERYPYIKRIYVRAEFPYISGSYEKYLSHRYEKTYYPDKLVNAGKAVYVERNFEKIDNSSFCICYYDANYTPSGRKRNKTDLIEYQPKSGTAIAYEYAIKRGLFMINVYKL